MRTCPNCGAESADDATFCMGCGFDLVQTGELKKSKPDTNAKHCNNCGAELDPEAVFCSKCGSKFEEVPEDGGKTMFFGAMQEKGQAKLTLIKGGGFEGVAYNLSSTDHLTGRTEGFILFPDDMYCSPRHANFFYFGGKFFVSDEGSLNGIFVRLKSPIELKDSMFFRCGEQLFMANLGNGFQPVPGLNMANDGTEFFGSPSQEPPALALTHIIEGGKVGSVSYSKGDSFSIGRDACDLNFPEDGFMSGKHVRITKSGDKYFLADSGSKNGTFYRILQEQELFHGDYVFVGQQLLRVEIN